MMGFDGGRRLMDRETVKPKNVLVTLARFGRYFRPYWPAMILVVVFMVGSTWTQVRIPEITGEAVDCFLFPQPASVCAYTAGDAKAIDADTTLPDAQKRDEKVAGVLTMALNVWERVLLGAALGGATAYSMS